MTVKDLWKVSPQSFIFVRKPDGNLDEIVSGPKGPQAEYRDREILSVLGTRYPSYSHVLEITVKEV